MSELKAYELKYGAYGMYLAEDGHVVDDNFVNFVYPKDQTDKVIAEKDAEIARLKAIRKVHVEAIESKGAGLLRDEEENRHSKYKRCLAMAKWCMARYNEWAAYYPTTTTRKMKFLDKWHKRWLAIAEKFKTNSTAQ